MMKIESARSGAVHRDWLVLVAFLVVVIATGGVLGVFNAPGAWYANLAKPPFNPPNWVFAPVWSLLYVLIAIAGWRLWKTEPHGVAMKLWVGQLVVNWAWTPVFFSLQMLWPALFVLGLMWALILGVILMAWRNDRPASVLMVPYLLWVSFAGLLNAAVAWLN